MNEYISMREPMIKYNDETLNGFISINASESS